MHPSPQTRFRDFHAASCVGAGRALLAGSFAAALFLAAPAAHAVPVLEKHVAAAAGGWLTGGGLTLGMTLGEGAVGLSLSIPAQRAEVAGFWGPGSVAVLGVGDDDGPATSVPPGLEIHPNPGSGVTVLRWSPAPAAHEAAATATIYDTRGRRIRTLQPVAAPGTWASSARTFHWDGRDDRGLEAGAGIYFCRMRSGPLTVTGRFARIR